MKSITYRDIRLTFINHSSFKLTTEGINIYTDPYRLPDNLPEADIILVTHDHYDHCDKTEIERISKETTIIIAPETVRHKLNREIKTIGQHETLTIGPLKIQSIPSYNKDKPYHPKGAGVSYLISTKNTNIFFSGDTDFTDEMRDLKNIDLALVPLGAPYTMDEKEAADFINHIRPKLAIPMHYGVVTKGDPYEFRKLVNPDTEVEIMG